jgi:hypothetical protein
VPKGKVCHEASWKPTSPSSKGIQYATWSSHEPWRSWPTNSVSRVMRLIANVPVGVA